MRFLKSSLLCVVLLSAASIASGEEIYRGTIWHSPSGMSSDVYIRKDPKDPRPLQHLREMMDTINALEKLRNERERLEMEREKLRLLKERNEIEKKRLEQELQRARDAGIQSDQNKTYRSSYRPSPSDYRQSPSVSDTQPASNPFKVYFKTGKELLCDRTWRDGSNIFLVVHGKKYAIGYAESEIDLEKSFR